MTKEQAKIVIEQMTTALYTIKSLSLNDYTHVYKIISDLEYSIAELKDIYSL